MTDKLYSIGEFSRVTGLTVKTLRFYHEQNVLKPTSVDGQTGYRYYGAEKVDTARVISRLRGLEFSLVEISEMLSQFDDEGDILEYLERRQSAIEEKLRHYRNVRSSLRQIISTVQEERDFMTQATFEVIQKTLEPVLVAGIRMKGKYSDCGKGFSRIGRRFGRHLNGKPLLLIHDTEYREDDADFEACMPVRKGESVDGVEVRELPGGTAVTLLHKGPYSELHSSYGKILKFAKDRGYNIDCPSREVYLKGPGMIFKGNPKKYLTEIQMLLAPSE